MDNVPRTSGRTNKGIPPVRFGFEDYAYSAVHPDMQTQFEEGAIGGINITPIENTLVRPESTSNRMNNCAKSVVSSKVNTKASRRSSIREVTHLKKTLEREAEIYEIEMQKLERKKEFLLRAQQLENEMKRQEDEQSNNDDDVEIPEMDNEQRKINTGAWVNDIANPHLSNDFERNRIFESTRLNQSQNSVQNDVLIAAFKALQTREVKDLPTFNGDNVLEWPNFISEFRRSTEEFNVTPNKNLRRLNKAIQGNARTSIQTLLTSPDNIEEIISHLEMSFGRREWILEHLILELRQLPVMKEENIHQFKLFYSKLFGAITTIRNMEAQNYLDNPELLGCLEEKLPPTTKNYWIHYKAEMLRRHAKVNIAALGYWFKFELDAQYAGLSAKDVLKKSNKATVLAIDSSTNKREKWCHNCNASVGHYLQDCNEFKKLAVEKRRDFVKQNNICFLCLRKGHQTKVCRNKNSLPKCSKCNKNHADILHSDNVQNTAPVAGSQVEEVRCIQTCDVLLKIALVLLKGPTKTMIVPAFFDDGSTATMIDEDLANDLGLEGNISPITYRWTNDIVRTDNESRMVKVCVTSTNRNSKFYSLNNVRTGRNLALPFQNFNVRDILHLHPYLDEEKLKKICYVQPLLLIGSNNAGLTVPLKTVQFRLNGLLECKSRLGWTIHGPIYENQSASASLSVHLMVQTMADEELNDLIKESYKVEKFGVTNEIEKLSENDEAALSIMQTTMKKIGDKFEIGHLYKFPERNFPTKESKRLALKRLHLIEKKMDRNEKFANDYIQRIDDYVKKGYAEKLNGDDLKETPNTYYLPHFDAYHSNKPGKFR